MIGFFKYSFYLIASLALLLVAAALLLPMVVKPNDFRQQIVQQVRDLTGRELSIGGDLEFSVFPWLGVELNQVALGNAPGFAGQHFARVEHAQVRARLLPLLQKRLEIGTLKLSGLQLSLSRDAAGRGNWDDLVAGSEGSGEGSGGGAGQTEQGSPLAALAVGGVELENARIDWDDQQTQQRLSIAGLYFFSGPISQGEGPLGLTLESLELDRAVVELEDRRQGRLLRLQPLKLQTGAIALGQPVDLRLDATFENTPPELGGTLQLKASALLSTDLKQVQLHDTRLDLVGLNIPGQQLRASLQLAGDMILDLERQQLGLEALTLQLDELLQGEALRLQGRVAAPGKVDLAQGDFAFEALRLEANVAGEGLPEAGLPLLLDASLQGNFKEQRVSLDNLRLQSEPLHLTGAVAGSFDDLRGQLALASFNPRQLLGKLGLPLPETRDDAVLSRAEMKTSLALGGGRVALHKLELTLDDSRMQGDLTLLPGNPPGYRFDLHLDRLNADRYMPPGRDAGQPSAAAQSAPAAADAQAVLLPLELLRGLDVEGKIRIDDLVLSNLTMRQSEIEVKSQSGALPQLRVREQARGIQAEDLVKDLSGEDRFAGIGQFNADLHSSGNSLDRLKRELGGKLDLQFRDGSVKGINIARKIREARALLKGETLPPDRQELKTDFSALSASAVIARGQLDNQDLQASSPLLRVTGKGRVDLVQERLDYLLTPVIVETSTGQDGKDLNDLAGLPIPIQLTGPLARPDWQIDIAQVVVEAQKRGLQDKAEDKIQQQLEKIGIEGLNVKGLFGR